LAIYGTITPTTYTGNTKTYFATDNVAKALKARAYALKGDYTNAETWANNVINTSGIVLATQAQYPSLFFQDNEPANTEVIFRLKRTTAQNTQGSNMHNGWCSVRPNLAGSPFYEVSRALYNKLAATPGDIRLATTVFTTGTTTTSSLIDPNYATSADVKNTDILVLHKHGGQSALTSANGFNPDFMVCRLSEMYFIRAEAKVAAGDLTGAAADLKIIMDARFATAQPAPVFASAQAAWKGILDERRKELSFEGRASD
jgi:hypothetical protein